MVLLLTHFEQHFINIWHVYARMVPVESGGIMGMSFSIRPPTRPLDFRSACVYARPVLRTDFKLGWCFLYGSPLRAVSFGEMIWHARFQISFETIVVKPGRPRDNNRWRTPLTQVCGQNGCDHTTWRLAVQHDTTGTGELPLTFGGALWNFLCFMPSCFSK